jgi:hypothetical protein
MRVDMSTQAQLRAETIPDTLALVPAATTEVGILRANPRRRRARQGLRFWFWRARDKSAIDGLDQLSASTLQTELRAIDDEIAVALQNIAALEAGEKEALEKRDKLALDVAWHGRETETTKIEQLEGRREAVYASLRRRLEPEVQAWQLRAHQAVAGWREEDREQLDRIEQALRDVESITWNLLNRVKRRAHERKGLLEQLDDLLGRAGPLTVKSPEIDWSVPEVSVRDITVRLESVLDLLGQPGLGLASLD